MFAPTTKILIVDDMLTMRKLVAKLLRELGYQNLTEAKDGLDAWHQVSTATEPFELIVSDWNMPNGNGLDFLKRVRLDARFRQLPFLMLTAEAEQHQVMEAVKAGASAYIIKPFKSDVLADRLASVYQQMKSSSQVA